MLIAILHVDSLLLNFVLLLGINIFVFFFISDALLNGDGTVLL